VRHEVVGRGRGRRSPVGHRLSCGRGRSRRSRSRSWTFTKDGVVYVGIYGVYGVWPRF